MFPWYIKNTTIKKNLTISTSNYITTLKHEKTKQALHLLWYVLLWLHPFIIKKIKLFNHTPTQGYVTKITKPHVTLINIF
jgi:hypothetical protein